MINFVIKAYMVSIVWNDKERNETFSVLLMHKTFHWRFIRFLKCARRPNQRCWLFSSDYNVVSPSFLSMRCHRLRTRTCVQREQNIRITESTPRIWFVCFDDVHGLCYANRRLLAEIGSNSCVSDCPHFDLWALVAPTNWKFRVPLVCPSFSISPREKPRANTMFSHAVLQTLVNYLS